MTLDEFLEISRRCVMHVDQDGNVMHFVRRVAPEQSHRLTSSPAEDLHLRTPNKSNHK